MQIKDIRRDSGTEVDWRKRKGCEWHGLPLMNCCLTLLEGSLVRRNTNIIWSTTISSSLVQKRTEQFREIDNLHLRNDAWTAQFIRSWSASGSTKNNWNTKY